MARMKIDRLSGVMAPGIISLTKYDRYLILMKVMYNVHNDQNDFYFLPKHGGNK